MELKQAVQNAERELGEQDPIIGALIKQNGTVLHYPRSDYFSSLCRSILGQQVSVASAAAVYKRLNDATNMDPVIIMQLDDTQLRNYGLSRQKAGYIRDLAQHFAEQPAIYNHLENQSDDEVVAELTAIKGIGVWTAQMFLMFTLSRLDIFAPDDIGIQRALKRVYGWDTLPSREALIKHAERWKPYRTVACWQLWESLHNTPE